MDRTAYVVRKTQFGGLGAIRVTVVRETKKSYILKTMPEKPGTRYRILAVEQEVIFGHTANYLQVARIFAKGGPLFFARDKALEECAWIIADRIVAASTTLACLEEDQAELWRVMAPGIQR